MAVGLLPYQHTTGTAHRLCQCVPYIAVAQGFHGPVAEIITHPPCWQCVSTTAVHQHVGSLSPFPAREGDSLPSLPAVAHCLSWTFATEAHCPCHHQVSMLVAYPCWSGAVMVRHSCLQRPDILTALMQLQPNILVNGKPAH